MSVIFQMSYYHSGKKSSSFSKTPTFTDGRNVLFKCPKLYEMTLFMCPQLHEMSIIFQMSYCISSTEKFFFSISFFRSIDGRKCALDQTLFKKSSSSSSILPISGFTTETSSDFATAKKKSVNFNLSTF